MKDNQFFKPTPLYKEFVILDLIEKNASITQRKMSEVLDVAVSMINLYLDEYEHKGYIKRKYKSSKTVEYKITSKGKERKKLLNISYLNASQKIYLSAKENIISFLKRLTKQGYKRILLYGAGEVAEILLQVITNEDKLGIEVLGVIDDDASKQGTNILDYPIISFNAKENFSYDGILISSYGHHETIHNKLASSNIDKDLILGFFD